MRRPIPVAALVLALGSSSCSKKAEPGAPYLLTTQREADAVRVEVRTAGDFHINDEYPVSFQPDDADAGRLQLKDQVKKSACVGDTSFSCSAQVSVPNGGGTLAFSVCSKENCLIEKVPIAAVR